MKAALHSPTTFASKQPGWGEEDLLRVNHVLEEENIMSNERPKWDKSLDFIAAEFDYFHIFVVCSCTHLVLVLVVYDTYQGGARRGGLRCYF